MKRDVTALPALTAVIITFLAAGAFAAIPSSESHHNPTNSLAAIASVRQPIEVTRDTSHAAARSKHAADQTSTSRGSALSGRITEVDDSARQIEVETSGGRKVAVDWSMRTVFIGGSLRVGEAVHVRFMKHPADLAYSIRVRPRKSS